jgi:hypothetical protein
MARSASLTTALALFALVLLARDAVCGAQQPSETCVPGSNTRTPADDACVQVRRCWWMRNAAACVAGRADSMLFLLRVVRRRRRALARSTLARAR